MRTFTIVVYERAIHQKPYQAPALQQSYQAPGIPQPSSTELDSGLVPSYNPSDDLITNLNKLMAFVSTTFGPCFPQTDKQLRTSSNPRNQATIQDGRVTEIPTPTAFQSDDLDAFDFDCDDVPLAKAAKAVLMANLSSYDLDVFSEVPFRDTNIENDMSSQSVQENQCSKQPLFDNTIEIDITSDSNIISYEQYLKETETLVVQSTSSSTPQDEILMSVIEEMFSQVAKCNKVQQENREINETLTVKLERYKEQAKKIKQRQKFDLNDREKYIDGQLRQVIVDRNAKVADFEKQTHSLKLQLNATVESHKTLSTTVECLKKDSKQMEGKYLDEFIDLQKKNKALDNVVYKMGQSTQTMNMLTKPQVFYDESHKTELGYQNPFLSLSSSTKVPALYDGDTIVKTHVALSVTDSEETLELAEESRLKMLAKQNDPSLIEKKVKIFPIDYVALNKLAEHFAKHFVPQKQLSAEQGYWLPISQPVVAKPPVPSEPALKKEIPRKLPSISLVKVLQKKWKMVASAFGEGGSSTPRPIGLSFLIASLGATTGLLALYNGICEKNP
nr:hypothetical protein [Tanacetum cinerariifolium]